MRVMYAKTRLGPKATDRGGPTFREMFAVGSGSLARVISLSLDRGVKLSRLVKFASRVCTGMVS